MPVKFHCRKCGKRFVEWGARKLEFKCPECEDEALVQVGSPEDLPPKRPSLKRAERTIRAQRPKSAGTRIAPEEEAEEEELEEEIEEEEEEEEAEVEEAEEEELKTAPESEQGNSDEEDDLDFTDKAAPETAEADIDDDEDLDTSDDLSFDDVSSRVPKESLAEDDGW